MPDILPRPTTRQEIEDAKSHIAEGLSILTRLLVEAETFSATLRVYEEFDSVVRACNDIVSLGGELVNRRGEAA